MMDRLLEICALDGTSGDEGAVRDYIKSSIHADKVITDNLGNLLVFKKGRKTPKNRIMFAAHMDEVGFMVTDITSDGFLRFGAVGGPEGRTGTRREIRKRHPRSDRHEGGSSAERGRAQKGSGF